MKHLVYILLLSTVLVSCSGTSTLLPAKPDVLPLAQLPKAIDETSGLIFFNSYFWTHNDSGGKAEIYAIDPDNGMIIQTVMINNAENIDWEDMTQDENYIYIADTGNNRGKRREFQIYKILKNDILAHKNSDAEVKAEIITFKFDYQPNNLKLYRHNYDMEALCVLKGQLFIFTKNWKNNKTNLYLIKDGIAQYQKTYNPEGLVTGVTYDKGNNTMYLIGYHRYIKVNNLSPFIYSITDYNTETEQTKKHLLTHIKGYQVEGITYVNGKIFFTNEANDQGKQALWEIILD